MRIKMRKIKFFIGILAIGIILTSIVTTVNADGGFFVPPRYNDIYQPSQKAIIIYDNGREDLILQVRYEKGAENFAWVVPVPEYPEVDKSDAKLFEELYSITTPTPGAAPSESGEEKAAVPSGVEVLERKRVGIYDVSILSATDPSALIEWLNKNGYNFPEEAESIVDFYIAKDWYFVAMRIDLEANKQEILDKIKELYWRIDTFNDAKTYLPELVADDIAKSESYNESVLSELAVILEDDEWGRRQYEHSYMLYWVDGHHNKSEIYEIECKSITEAIDAKFKDIEKNLNEGTIQPIKFSFNSTQIIYPLKITSLNPGDTEVLLYVFTDNRTNIQNFTVDYGSWIFPGDIYKFKALKSIVIKPYYLTKLRKVFSHGEIVDDLFISEVKTHKKVVFNLHSPLYVGENLTIEGVAYPGTTVDIAINDIVTAELNDIPIAENREFRVEIDTATTTIDALKTPGHVVEVEVFVDRQDRGVGVIGSEENRDGWDVIRIKESHVKQRLPTPSPTHSLVPPATKPSLLIPSPTASPSLTPTPSIHGFEVVFAIAGLLAVAYLIRRKK